MKRLMPGFGACAVALAAASLAHAAPSAGDAVPANLGLGLRPLAQLYQRDPAAAEDRLRQNRHAQFDARGRVMVSIFADGSLSAEAMRKPIADLGADVTNVYTRYRKGVISAYVPIAALDRLAMLPGVSSVVFAPKPITNVGSTTSQGVPVLRSDEVNADGFTGDGITVGVMSDSFNRALGVAAKAADDVASGDLPDLTNSNSRSPGVKFLIEGPIGTSDEGRAMAQIVYDVAPDAELCFATAYNTEAQFASNIIELRTNPACNADVIVDDIIYFAEPMFSDGVVAQAVDEVVTSKDLAGKRVSYFSSAGNRSQGYSDRFRKVNPNKASKLDNLTVDLSTIPGTIDVSGGFQDFDQNDDNIDIDQALTCSGSACTVLFQWDDPFDLPGGMTTDFNVLVFGTDGVFDAALSMTDDNFATNQPIEASAVDLQADTTYYIVIARTGVGTHESKFLKYVTFGGEMLAEYNDEKGEDASTYGHNSAAKGNGVAAYVYDDSPGAPAPLDGYNPSLEGFSSPGPVKILFDKDGNRLSEVEKRQKPDIAAPDGVNTTFFPSGPLTATDYEGDGFPNFFGTSAAAPHAAGVAALLLEKAGGPESLGAGKVRHAMQDTAPARDKDPGYAAAVYSDGSEQLARISISGSNPEDPDAFKIELMGSGLELTELTIDVTPTGLEFDPNAEGGFPLTVGSSTGPVITSPLPTEKTQVLTLTFSGFTSGNTLTFGIDRDVAAIAGYGNSADLLGGALVTGTVNGLEGTLTMGNKFGTGFVDDDGYGLIDAKAAADSID